MPEAAGLTRSLAAFVADLRAEDLPDAAREIAVTGFVDCLAVIVPGWRTDVARHLRMTQGLAGWTEPFTGTAPTSEERALHLAVAAHALDFDDTAIAGHPSAVLVPTILAELRHRPRAGRDALAAWIAGYEVWAELHKREPDPLHAKGWHPSAVYGPPAAAAAVACLRELEAERTATAMSLAASMSGGLVAQFGSWAKPWQLARAARAGHEAAALAEAGMQAAADALEHPLGLLASLSPQGKACLDGPRAQDLHVLHEGLNVKFYPVCYAMHRVLDATATLVAEYGLAAGAVDAVIVEIGGTQAGLLRHDRPDTAAEARFSLQFGIASVLLRGRCGPRELDETFIRSDEVRDLLPRIDVVTIDERSAEEPAHSPWDRVTIRLEGGRELVSEKVAHPLGHFRRRAPQEALRAKFDACVEGLMERDRAEALYRAASGLATLADTRALFGDRELAHAS